MLKYTTDELITAVRHKAYLPPVGGMTDEEVLTLINLERTSTMAEAIKRASPSYWRTSYDFTLVTGQSEYRIPDRALMSGIEEAYFVDSNGTQVPVIELDASERWRYALGGADPLWPGPFAHAMEGEHLRLLPAPTAQQAGKTLRVFYYRQPSVMVKVSEARRIDSAGSTETLATNTADDANGDLAVGAYADVVRGAGMFGPIAVDRLVTTVSSGVVEFDPSTPIVVADISTYVVGKRQDYVCTAGETVFPEFPAEMWPALVSASAVQVLVAQKDFAHADFERQELQRKLASTSFLAEPRSKEPDVIMNRNSPLRRGRGWYR